MLKYRKTFEVEAYRWFKNGDHPEDYLDGIDPLTPEERKAADYEGSIVRWYRDPYWNSDQNCAFCSYKMHDHGWIDSSVYPANGATSIVCPGDYILKSHSGDYYPVHPDTFEATYELLPEIQSTIPLLNKQEKVNGQTLSRGNDGQVSLTNEKEYVNGR